MAFMLQTVKKWVSPAPKPRKNLDFLSMHVNMVTVMELFSGAGEML